MSWQLKAGSCGSYSGIFPNVCVSLWEEVLGGVKGIDAIAPLASVDPRGSWSEGGEAGFAPCVVAVHHSSLPALPLPPVEVVDNTVTLIILAVVGGVIGLLVCILLLKKLITFILKKTREKK